ncbi:MAG: VOC family protein [Chitinophagaceae bacterium]|nr:VOC family protein [Chitinophagaceae bacterium]
MDHVTGIGGVFLKAKDPKAMTAWYEKYLGIPFGENLYVAYPWNDPQGNTVFSFFKQESKYFDPSTSPVMLNLRVRNLTELLAKLKQDGVWVDEKTENAEYGKFGWTMDPEGNKIELWEPAG